MKNDSRLVRADRLFSMIVRQRDGRCRRCEEPVAYELLQAHHFIKRRYRNTRFVLDNAVSLCWPCHDWAEGHPVLAEEFAVSIVGQERFDELKALARRTSKVDLDEVLEELRSAA